MYELNEQQRAAAEFLEGIAIVVAVPGSGKTLTMVHRIANLVKNGVAPENILGITFTRNAANALKERLNTLIGGQASRVNLSTIHGLCYRILRNEGITINLLEDYKKSAILRKILKEIDIKDIEINQVIAEIKYAKNSLIPPEKYISQYEHNKTFSNIGYAYREYEKVKDSKGLLDFEDMLTDTYNLLTQTDEVRRAYSNLFLHILIDEFQDTNPAQLEIIKTLGIGNDNRSLYAVGDDSQSIYSFTGASIDSILQFKKMFPAAIEFRLTLNYRSTPQILEACSNLISHNCLKIDKELITSNPQGEQVTVWEASSEEEEANFIVNEIKAITGRNLFCLREIVVLYRANFQSRILEEELFRNSIPYSIENNSNFYQRREIGYLLDYLRVIHDPLSERGGEALINILNVPNRYLGNRVKQDLKSYAHRRGLSVFLAMKEMSFRIPYEHHNIRAFINLLEFMKKEADGKPPTQVVSLLRSALDYDRYISEGDISVPDDPKIANINQLQEAASRFDDIASFLEHASQFQQVISTQKQENVVRLMTIHKSKGMEFPVVFMVGLVMGLLPMDRGDIEEERRIAFVGMSRASNLLHLSYSTQNGERLTEPSVFLSEMRYRKPTEFINDGQISSTREN